MSPEEMEQLDRLDDAYNDFRDEHDDEYPVESAEECTSMVELLFRNLNIAAPRIQTTVVPDRLDLIKERDDQRRELSLCFAWIVDKAIERVRAGENIRSLAF